MSASAGGQTPLVQTPLFQVTVPASTANLGPGFDTLGAALTLYNRFYVSIAQQDSLSSHPNSLYPLPAEVSQHPEQNPWFSAMDAWYRQQGKRRPALAVTIECHIPLARGLGSSASVVAGALLAANHLEGSPNTLNELLPLAIAQEGHPDNVAAALLGGACLCDGNTVYPLPWPNDWHLLAVIPSHVKVSTEEARRALPTEYPRDTAVFNLRKTGLLVHALHSQDKKALSNSLMDLIHQPVRAQRIEGFSDMQALAIANGGFGAVVSGSGPTTMVIYPAEANTAIQQAFQHYCEKRGQSSLQLLPVQISTQGGHIEHLSSPA
ncbi:MAG: homoserine kinase [Candidatus Melainabacteria bacterium]|nr:homoserine kinase [Candidatus Melainabacteria bacterium]